MTRKANYKEISGPDGHIANLRDFEGNTMSAYWTYDLDKGHIYVVLSYYQEIAELINGELTLYCNNKEAYYAIRGLAYSLTDILARENPKFDREKFYDVAGLRYATEGDTIFPMRTP